MPRFSRSTQITPFFHIMTQGINKSYIFKEPEEIKYYIKIMYELLEDYNLKIIAYCIMNNHAHILINAKSLGQLSKYMQRLNIRYGKYYNKKHNRVGYVFRDRYKSEGIYNENHLYNCIKYIYDNPVKAGICERPEDYPYSNYKPIPARIYSNNYSFIDIEEDKENTYISEIESFIDKKCIDMEKLKKDTNNLRELIKFLQTRHGLSLRKIAKILGIGRETLIITTRKTGGLLLA